MTEKLRRLFSLLRRRKENGDESEAEEGRQKDGRPPRAPAKKKISTGRKATQRRKYRGKSKRRKGYRSRPPQAPARGKKTVDRLPLRQRAAQLLRRSLSACRKAAVSVWKAVRPLWKLWLFWSAAVLLCEIVLRCKVFGGLSAWLFTSLGFALSFAALLTVITGMWRKPAVNAALRYLLYTLLFLPYAIQIVYFQIFDAMLSLAFVGMGGEAVGAFTSTVFGAIFQCLPQIILLLLPYPALFLLHRKKLLSREGFRLPALLGGAAACLLLYGLAMLPVAGNGMAASVYRDPFATVERQTEFFGLFPAGRLELQRMSVTGVALDLEVPDLTDASGEDPEEAEERNIMPKLDFEKLAEGTDDQELKDLSTYFAGRAGTLKNEYTGMFEGYNLIEICAEAFSPYLVSKELTPTLYRISRESIQFPHFYNSFPSVTTNGEYSMAMGLLPDLVSVSFADSMDNLVPFCMGNRFRALGVTPHGYHNNIGSFYNRANTHANMGYEFKALGYGLDMETRKPNSDLEMMQKTVDDYIHDQRFMAYYMTYSGHMEYDFTNNAMSIRHRDRVAHLDCSEQLKAYYACQLELEDALTYLIGRLEEAGVADRTVIVLSADHYPYGLSEENYRELMGKDAETDPYWKYRSALYCWTEGMDGSIVADEYCCGQDILPTLLNLFGLEFDSRLMTGRDILADTEHIALLQDGSFLTKAFSYNANTGKVTWSGPRDGYPSDYAVQLQRAVKNDFAVSKAILSTDYYRYAFDASGIDYLENRTETYSGFPDIAGTWYEEEVGQLVSFGALSGRGGKFGGDLPADRSIFLAMLVRPMHLKSPQKEPPYQDIEPGTWYYPLFSAAWGVGILPDGDACEPQKRLTIGDARTMLAAAAEYAGIPDSSEWARKIVVDVVRRARAAGEDAEYFSKGAAAAMAAPLAMAAQKAE